MILRAALLFALTLFFTACSSDDSEPDILRLPPSQQGTSFALQANRHTQENQATIAAAMYVNGKYQGLVGGDFFQASSSIDKQRLASFDQANSRYLGRVEFEAENPLIAVETIYDPIAAREDRWYPVEQLLVDPGPNEALLGYRQNFSFPATIADFNSDQAIYTDQEEFIQLSWQPGNGQQMALRSQIYCRLDRDFNFSYFQIIGPDDGQASFKISSYLNNASAYNGFDSLKDSVIYLLSGGIFKRQKDIFLLSRIQYCEINFVLYREIGLDLPEGINGGFVVASRSAETQLRFEPELVQTPVTGN